MDTDIAHNLLITLLYAASAFFLRPLAHTGDVCAHGLSPSFTRQEARTQNDDTITPCCVAIFAKK